MSRGRHSTGLCGPDCKYRSLYEGSQNSLTDMASKQASALSRVGRLRQGAVEALKQAFPVEFADAETQLGRRMSTVDDEILIAYLTGFLVMPKQATAANTGPTPSVPDVAPDPTRLRESLSKAGVMLPADDDPDAWSHAVDAWAATKTAPQVSAAATEPGRAPEVHVSEARMVSDVGEPELAAAAANAEPAEWMAGLVEPDHFTAPDPSTYAEPDIGDDAWQTLFGEEEPAELDSSLADLFADDPVPADTQPEATTTLDSVRPVEEPVSAVAPPAAKAATQAPIVEAAPVNPDRAVSTRDQIIVKPEPPATPPARRAQAKSRPKRKTPRVSAAGPGNNTDPIAELKDASGASELTDELREKLLAVVCLPRPVFLSDLADMIDNPELIQQWEQECRSQGTESPLRFIAAKQRHKARGPLVIPFAEELRTASAGFEKSLWAQCINSTLLRGAKLYELAVLLHATIDKVVTFDIGSKIVHLRINQTRGLVGVALVLDADIGAESETRAELGDRIADLVGGRLNLLAVCTYTGGARSVPELAQAAREEIDARDLSPGFPVIAQTSWDFATDGGTSAVSVL